MAWSAFEAATFGLKKLKRGFIFNPFSHINFFFLILYIHQSWWQYAIILRDIKRFINYLCMCGQPTPLNNAQQRVWFANCELKTKNNIWLAWLCSRHDRKSPYELTEWSFYIYFIFISCIHMRNAQQFLIFAQYKIVFEFGFGFASLFTCINDDYGCETKPTTPLWCFWCV